MTFCFCSVAVNVVDPLLKPLCRISLLTHLCFGEFLNVVPVLNCMGGKCFVMLAVVSVPDPFCRATKDWDVLVFPSEKWNCFLLPLTSHVIKLSQTVLAVYLRHFILLKAFRPAKTNLIVLRSNYWWSYLPRFLQPSLFSADGAVLALSQPLWTARPLVPR